MRQASGTIGPSKSAYSMVDGGPALAPVPTDVTPEQVAHRGVVLPVEHAAELGRRRDSGDARDGAVPESPPAPVPFAATVTVVDAAVVVVANAAGATEPARRQQSPKSPANEMPHVILHGSRGTKASLALRLLFDVRPESPGRVARAVLLHQSFDARLVAAALAASIDRTIASSRNAPRGWSAR